MSCCVDLKQFLSAVPKQFWIWLAVAVFSWVLRGKTITLPKLSFVAWVLLNVWLGGAVIADAFLPMWAASPIYWGRQTSGSPPRPRRCMDAWPGFPCD